MNLNNKLHYSVRFEGENIKYHGEISFFRELTEGYQKHIDEMRKICKVGLMRSLKKWGYEADQLVFSEFYFYFDGKEINFFTWCEP